MTGGGVYTGSGSAKFLVNTTLSYKARLVLRGGCHGVHGVSAGCAHDAVLQTEPHRVHFARAIRAVLLSGFTSCARAAPPCAAVWVSDGP